MTNDSEPHRSIAILLDLHARIDEYNAAMPGFKIESLSWSSKTAFSVTFDTSGSPPIP